MILEELITALTPIGVPIETGLFSGDAPDQYIVLVPLADEYPLHADNLPIQDTEEVRISIYTKTNYMRLKTQILARLIINEFTITERRYNGFEENTGYHHYTIDVAKSYEVAKEEI